MRQRTIQRQCTSPVVAYLGYPLWSDSRFSVNAFFPIPGDWKLGGRLMYCYVSLKQDAAGPYAANRLALYTGRVKGKPQDRVRPTGTCLTQFISSSGLLTTSCRALHDGQVTGRIDTRRLPHPPRDVITADQVTSALCQSITYEFRHHQPLPPTAAVWGTITPRDWAEGQRTVECYWAYLDGNPSRFMPSTTQPRRPTTTRPGPASTARASTTAPTATTTLVPTTTGG